MITGYKIYLEKGKYKLLTQKGLIEVANKQMMYKPKIRKNFLRKDIDIVDALSICEQLEIQVKPADVMLIKSSLDKQSTLKSIQSMEEDIQEYIFEQIKEKQEEDVEKFIIKDIKEYTALFDSYFKGSRNAMLDILQEGLKYEVVEGNDTTLPYFVDKEVYLTSNISYKNNIITVELSKDKFICDLTTQKIHKYKATIINEEGYQFNFKKEELFISREAGFLESQKLVDEHYNLKIKNSKIERITVRTHDGIIVVFWPSVKMKEGFIKSNDLIGKFDLAGDTETSIKFFEQCKDATEEEIQLAKDVILNCMNLKTFNVKKL